MLLHQKMQSLIASPLRGGRNCLRLSASNFGWGGALLQQSPHPKCLVAKATQHFDLPARGR